MSDDLIKVPSFLSTKAEGLSISPRCSFCVEVACETDAMACGQCSGQSCSGQCTSAECGQCGSCERGQCGTCQSSCQSGCQNAEGCTTTCERACQSGQEPAPTTYGSITSISSTATTITIRYTSIPNAVWYQVHYRKSTTIATTPIANGSSLSCTITGLSPDTEYKVNYRGATATVFGPFMPNGKIIRTERLVIRPDDWDWGCTVKPGARLPTAREWDNFCVRINEFRDYKGLSGYSFTKAYPGPTTLTAAMVNQTITAIKAMSPSTSPPSSAAKNVTKLSAALLNGLAASLNSIR